MNAGALRGRSGELATLDAITQRVTKGQSAALVIAGDAGVGKSALLEQWMDRIPSPVVVRRMVAAESEMELAYAGLQFLCGSFMNSAEQLPTPQRDALQTALGLRVGTSPNPLLVGLAALGLLTEAAGDNGLVCVIDDAQWLDAASARAITFAARRVEAEGLAVVLAMRTAVEPFDQLPRLTIEGLGDAEARELLRSSLPGPIDPRVREQLIAEARGNPLALRELPRALTPADMAGGFAINTSMPLESRIEQSLIAQLDSLPDSTRDLLVLAAADPTGDAGLLWRARTQLGIGPEHLDVAAAAGALVVGDRVRFRHPLIRSAVYRSADAEARRRAHGALAAATYDERDPDRKAWHRANAAVAPDEGIAADLERCAARARERGGAAAAAAFLERSAALTPTSGARIDRLIAAAEAKYDAGASSDALRLLDGTMDEPLSSMQAALVERLRACTGYALRRDSSATRQLLAAAQGLDGLDPQLARDTYIEALAAALYGGRLGNANDVADVANAILAATEDDTTERAHDLLLRGQALLAANGQKAAIPTLRRALRAYLDHPPDALELRWMWFASRAAQDLWDANAMRRLAARQVDLARSAGLLSVLPIALSLLMLAQALDGDPDGARASCDEIEALQLAMGHSLPRLGSMFIAAYRGPTATAERLICEVRADGQARGEGYAISASNFAEAILYNGLGRYPEALEAARRELPHTHELNHAMRTLNELVEAAVRCGEREVAEQAVQQLAEVTIPLDNDWSLGMLAMARAQLADTDDAERLYLEAIERFDRERIPIMIGRSRLLYGEMLRRVQRRVDARTQLRSAHEILAAQEMSGFAERAARELSATGDTIRVRTERAYEQLTDQEQNVARLAREGLSNREIGARLFISDRTAEYHLSKVFTKLGIKARRELTHALTGDEVRATRG